MSASSVCRSATPSFLNSVAMAFRKLLKTAAGLLGAAAGAGVIAGVNTTTGAAAVDVPESTTRSSSFWLMSEGRNAIRFLIL